MQSATSSNILYLMHPDTVMTVGVAAAFVAAVISVADATHCTDADDDDDNDIALRTCNLEISVAVVMLLGSW